MTKITKKTGEKTISIWDYYPWVQLAAQRYCLIKKALNIKGDDLNDEVNWIMGTFEKLSEEGETTCGYLTIKTYKEEDGKQKIAFYFDLAEN